MPAGVLVPRTMEDALTGLALAREMGVPDTGRVAAAPRSADRPFNTGLRDRHLHISTRCLSFDKQARTCVVEPGLVLDDLNRWLKPHGLWFP